MIKPKIEFSVPKRQWGDGPWKNEPDEDSWIDSETGFVCLAWRNFAGCRCGYVAVPFTSAAFWIPHYDFTGVPVHGGLTFGMYELRPKGTFFNKYLALPRKWYGFDCGHAWDYPPAMAKQMSNPRLFEDTKYRTLEFTRSECKSLARRLKDISWLSISKKILIAWYQILKYRRYHRSLKKWISEQSVSRSLSKLLNWLKQTTVKLRNVICQKR